MTNMPWKLLKLIYNPLCPGGWVLERVSNSSRHSLKTRIQIPPRHLVIIDIIGLLSYKLFWVQNNLVEVVQKVKVEVARTYYNVDNSYWHQHRWIKKIMNPVLFCYEKITASRQKYKRQRVSHWFRAVCLTAHLGTPKQPHPFNCGQASAPPLFPFPETQVIIKTSANPIKSWNKSMLLF